MIKDYRKSLEKVLSMQKDIGSNITTKNMDQFMSKQLLLQSSLLFIIAENLIDINEKIDN